MKKIYLPILLFATLGAQAQIPVSHSVQKKRILMEEFTGMHCGYCPEGHNKLEELLNNNPGTIDAIAVHASQLAEPFSTSEIDMQTTFGYNLLVQAYDNYQATGLPYGTVNRHKFTNLNPYGIGLISDLQGNSQWATAVPVITAQDAYVNIGVDGTYNPNDRKLTINVELYYTSSTVKANNLNIALIQDSIIGPQSDYSSNKTANPNGWVPGSNYKQYYHRHVLRHLITGQWGEVITETKNQGTTITRQYVYTIPQSYSFNNPDPQAVESNVPVDVILKNLKIVAFVAEGQKEVIQTTSAAIVNNVLTGTEEKVVLASASLYPNPVQNNATLMIYDAADKNVSVNILNATGELVFAQNYGVLNGTQNLNLDMSSFSAGIYFVKVTTGDQSSTHKIVVNN
jgi:hypothetical protein